VLLHNITTVKEVGGDLCTQNRKQKLAVVAMETSSTGAPRSCCCVYNNQSWE
jgi:hypothetical protein